MSFLKRYERFGWDYASANPISEREAAWYQRHARETGGGVLDLACGTGRLLCALAEDGHAVTGLDLSPGMLELARARVAALAPEARARVTLVRGDMAAFDLGRRFGLVAIADNSFREVETREGLARVLACAARHLAPRGRLLVTERRFDPTLYPDGLRELPWSEPSIHPETGERVRRRIRVRLDDGAGRIDGEMVYRVERADGSVADTVCRFSGPVMTPGDYLALFSEAGYHARLRVGYEDREDDGRESMLCFVLTRA